MFAIESSRVVSGAALLVVSSPCFLDHQTFYSLSQNLKDIGMILLGLFD